MTPCLVPRSILDIDTIFQRLQDRDDVIKSGLVAEEHFLHDVVVAAERVLLFCEGMRRKEPGRASSYLAQAARKNTFL
jgi:hypothetical protein